MIYVKFIKGNSNSILVARLLDTYLNDEIVKIEKGDKNKIAGWKITIKDDNN